VEVLKGDVHVGVLYDALGNRICHEGQPFEPILKLDCDVKQRVDAESMRSTAPSIIVSSRACHLCSSYCAHAMADNIIS